MCAHSDPPSLACLLRPLLSTIRLGLTIVGMGWQGKGEGQLELKITYFPFELLYSKPRDASLVCARAPHPLIFIGLHSALYILPK